MYGYIRPDVPELRIREYAFYRGVYCGLCRRMGKCTGQCSRLTLSYDAVCLALFRLALTEGQTVPLRIENRRCPIHPLVRRPTLVPDAFTDRVLDYVAVASALLARYKLDDDRADEHGWRRLQALTFSPIVSGAHRRSQRYKPALAERLTADMNAFSRVEKKCLAAPSADRPADAFGRVLSTVFSFGLAGENARLAAVCGTHLGRWLYLLDAADDCREDSAAGRFNPLVALYGSGTEDRDIRALWERQLNADLAAVSRALDLVTFPPTADGQALEALLSNLVRRSLPQTTHRVLFPEDGKQQKNRKETFFTNA